MQRVSNDMDDLFREAAAQYPLQTGKPEWEKLAQQIHAPKSAAKKWINIKKWIGLLLLLALPFVCNYYFKQREGIGYAFKKQPALLPIATGKKAVANKEEKSNTTAIGTTIQGAAIRKQAAVQMPRGAIIKKEKGNKSEILASIHKSLKTKAPSQSLSFLGGAAAKEKAMGSDILKLPANQNTIHTDPQKNAIYNAINHALLTAPPDSNFTATISLKAKKKNRHLYTGLFVSADFTTVKLQKAARTGWQYGLLAGYQFRNKWSIETGLSLSRKYYYSEGSYFKSSRTYLPPNSKITEVDGTCSMLEIPLSVKYDLKQNRRYDIFATAGVTSYFVKKEVYDFTYYYGNSGTYAVHSRSYKNASANLFSVLQLTGGYSRKLASAYALRIEPYLKLPLTGLGYGKLPFTSAGINLGIVKKW